jgi:hypothetical protein
LSALAPTLLDWAKRLDPDGSVALIVELLSQTNAILEDMPFIEGNLPTGHQTTVRTGLPTVAWRLLNQASGTSKSTTAQITEQCGIMEAWSECDVDLAKLNGNVKKYRWSEAQAFLEAMNQEAAGTIFNGNAGTAPEEFTGFAPRYSSTTATNGSNVISAGGSGSDNSSIYLVGWGEPTVVGIFPKGSKAGLVHDDYGEVTQETTAGNGSGTRMRVYQERYQWKLGIALKDWRYAVRICNIDISNLIGKSSAADLVEMMIKATYRIPNLNACKPIFYCNRTVMEFLDIQKRDTVIAGGGITFQNVDGKRVGDLRGIPVKICDQLLENETAVS